MSYKFSSRTIPRVQVYLDELFKHPEIIDFQHSNPQKLARHLFEAFALGFKTNDKRIIEAKNKYRIRVLHDRIRVELRDSPINIIQARAPETLTIDSVTNLREVIGAVIEHKAASMDFPAVSLDDEELQKLSTWAKSLGYTVTTIPQLKVFKNGRQDSEGNRD